MTTGCKGVVLQPRDRIVLESLARLRVLDREQIASLAGFTSVTRVNVRLAKLRATGLIVRYFTSSSTGSRRFVYALSGRGVEEIGAVFNRPRWQPDSVIVGNAFIGHQLRMADIYIAAKKETITWEQQSAPLDASAPIIPDALVTTPSQTFFLELDLGTEPIKVWAKKVLAYVRFAASGAFRKTVAHPSFAVLVVTVSNKRLQALRHATAKQTSKLFWFATLDTIMGQGFWSASWLRATGDHRSPPGA